MNLNIVLVCSFCLLCWYPLRRKTALEHTWTMHELLDSSIRWGCGYDADTGAWVSSEVAIVSGASLKKVSSSRIVKWREREFVITKKKEVECFIIIMCGNLTVVTSKVTFPANITSFSAMLLQFRAVLTAFERQR